jgi:hypothetical protein
MSLYVRFYGILCVCFENARNLLDIENAIIIMMMIGRNNIKRAFFFWHKHNWLSLKDGIPLRKTKIPLTENGKLKDGKW